MTKVEEEKAEISDVLHEVLFRRIDQINKGYTPEHDDEHGAKWLIEETLNRAGDALIGGLHAEELRDKMLDVAALAVATIEAIDRKAERDDAGEDGSV